MWTVLLLLCVTAALSNPQCRWLCDDPVCNATCRAVCLPPKCVVTSLDTPGIEISGVHASCTTKCDGEFAIDTCPQCEIHCKPPPLRNAEILCEAPDCRYDCTLPKKCNEPRCELACEQAECQADPAFLSHAVKPKSNTASAAMINLYLLLGAAFLIACN